MWGRGNGVTRRDVLAGATRGLALAAIDSAGAQAEEATVSSFQSANSSNAESGKTQPMNVFISIPVPPTVANFLHEILGCHKELVAVESANYHITVVFLGRADAAEVLSQLRWFDFTAPQESLRVESLSVFDEKEPKILYASVAPSIWLASIHARVEAALQKFKAKQTTHTFIPHITLGYVNGSIPLEVSALLGKPIPNVSFVPTELRVLTATDEHREGPYGSIGIIPLKDLNRRLK